MHESVRWQCFSSIEKEPKLPGPTGSLSAGVPSSLDCYERDYNCCYNEGILMVIRLSLMWQLFTNGSIIYIYMVSMHHRFNTKLAIITALSNCMCDVGVVRCTSGSGHGLVIVKP